jgi:hypothetical protein
MADPIFYIGLGRAGSRVIDGIKREYVSENGSVPGNVRFLAISFSESFFGLSLSENEIVSLDIAKPLQSFRAIKGTQTWMPDENIKYLPLISSFGASHIRTNGKFAFLWNYDKVYRAVLGSLSSLPESAVIPTIKVVSSMSGGTGSAIAINVAYMIFGILPVSNVQLFAILPQMYINAGDCHALISSNAYESMRELDYLMTEVSPDNPYMVNLIGGAKQYTQPPYRHVFAFNTKLGLDYRAIERSIAATIKLSGDLSGSIGAFLDNIQMSVLDGICDVQGKKSWLASMNSRVVDLNGQLDDGAFLNTLAESKPSDMCPQVNFGFVQDSFFHYFILCNKDAVGDDFIEKLRLAFDVAPDIVFNNNPSMQVKVLALQSAFPAFFIEGLLHYGDFKEQIGPLMFTGMEKELTDKLDALEYTLAPQIIERSDQEGNPESEG